MKPGSPVFSGARHIQALLLAALMFTPVGCSSDAPSEGGDDSAATPQSLGSEYAATDPERAEVIAALQSLFDALGSGDGEALRELLDPQIRMNSVERDADGNPGGGTQTLDQLIQRVEADGPPLIERMFDPEVRISGDLATIWTPYDFYIGTEFSHCGADAVTLRRSDGRWQVVALNWTRLQPPACPLHPDGPPQ